MDKCGLIFGSCWRYRAITTWQHSRLRGIKQAETWGLQLDDLSRPSSCCRLAGLCAQASTLKPQVQAARDAADTAVATIAWCCATLSCGKKNANPGFHKCSMLCCRPLRELTLESQSRLR